MEKSPSIWKRYLILIGIIFGYALTSFFAPKLISWYSEPPFEVGVNCTPGISWGMTQIIRFQIGGMVLGLIGSVIVSRMASKRGEDKAL